jgi:hypothetical protein
MTSLRCYAVHADTAALGSADTKKVYLVFVTNAMTSRSALYTEIIVASSENL